MTGGLSRWAARLYEGPAFTCHHEADEARLAHLIHRVAQEADVVVVDTAGFGNRAATVAMTAADAVLIPMVPGEGDVTEAARTVELVAGVASAARREIPSRGVLNRVRSSTALSRHAAAEAGPLPKLEAGLSDLVAYGEMGFSGRMPAGKAGAEAAALIAELRAIGFLPAPIDNTASVKTKYVKTARAGPMKGLKSTRQAPAASPDEMLRIAGAAAPQQPSAIAQTNGADKSAMLSVRLTEATLDSLANDAFEQGTTQRRIIAEALAARGIQVAARDLEDRPPPRRRGSVRG